VNLDPAIAARVAELEHEGMLRGDAIGVAAAEQHLQANPPPWLVDLLVELDNPEGEPR
jgi:hypothetical protein